MYKCTECNEQHEEKVVHRMGCETGYTAHMFFCKALPSEALEHGEKVVTENLVLIENQEDIAEVN